MKSKLLFLCCLVAIIFQLTDDHAQTSFVSLVPGEQNKSAENFREISRVTQEFWQASEKGDFNTAKNLRTDTIDGFTIIVVNDTSPWEKVINETDMHLLRTLNFRCTKINQCEILILVQNKYGREFSLNQTLVKTNSGWRIRYISY